MPNNYNIPKHIYDEIFMEGYNKGVSKGITLGVDMAIRLNPPYEITQRIRHHGEIIQPESDDEIP